MADRRPAGFNVDLGFYDSPEVESIPRRIRAAAIGVWTLCGSYSANKLLDGYVGPGMLKKLGCTPAIRAALKSTLGHDGEPSPLWVDAANGGIQFTRWTKWQRTRAEVKAYRESEAERKRNARNGKRTGTTSDDAEMSGRTDTGPSQDVRPEDGNPRGDAGARQSETKPETKSKSLTGVNSGVSAQTHNAHDPNAHTPQPPQCPDHPDGDAIKNCGGCLRAREARKIWQETEDELEQMRADAHDAEQRRLAELIPGCPDCRGDGWVLDAIGEPLDPAVSCTHPRILEAIHA